jgi:hypothetical protein
LVNRSLLQLVLYKNSQSNSHLALKNITKTPTRSVN